VTIPPGSAADVLTSLARRVEAHETHAALSRARVESAVALLVHCLQYERGVTVLHAATEGARMGPERTTAEHESLAAQQRLVDMIAGLEAVALAECTGAADAFHSMSFAVGTLTAARGSRTAKSPEARASAISPKVLLLDEPFGMLDSLTRWELQTVLMEVWERIHLTAVLVTHDIDEAILLADRVVMMTNGPNARVGKILEIDLPRPRSRQALLDHPRYYELRGELLDFLESH